MDSPGPWDPVRELSAMKQHKQVNSWHEHHQLTVDREEKNMTELPLPAPYNSKSLPDSPAKLEEK